MHSQILQEEKFIQTPPVCDSNINHSLSSQCLYFAIYGQSYLWVCTALHWQSLQWTCAEPRHSGLPRHQSGAGNHGASGSSPARWQSSAAVPTLDLTQSTCTGGKQRQREGSNGPKRRGTVNAIIILFYALISAACLRVKRSLFPCCANFSGGGSVRGRGLWMRKRELLQKHTTPWNFSPPVRQCLQDIVYRSSLHARFV